MRLVPKRIVEKIVFFETHVEPFTRHAEAIGSTPESAAEFAALVTATRAAFDEQQRAMQAARAATLKLNDLARRTQRHGQAIVARARAAAQSRGDVGVLTLAQLPMQKKKSPLPAPGVPTRLRTTLDAVGNLTLSWACRNPRDTGGTMYTIWREIAGMPREKVAIVGKRRFTDTTIPRGVTRLTYFIRPDRSTGPGETASFDVSFGTNEISPEPRTWKSLFVAA
jgi:hypothetical protein